MNKIDFKFISKSFENSKILKIYSKAVDDVKLWKSEEIIFSNHFSKNDNLLIIGCGAGRVPINMFINGYLNVIGVDLSLKMIQIAKRISESKGIKIKFQKANMIDLPFGDNLFQGVVMPYNVLMHAPKEENRIKAMQEVNRVLYDKGKFIFTTHDDRNKNILFNDFWKNEIQLWNNNKNNSLLHEYGDRIINDKKGKIFMHFPTNKEVEDLIKMSKFKLESTFIRSHFFKENEAVDNFSNDCRFWLATKMPY